MALIIWIMFAHYVADFLVQTEWMAKGKSKRWAPLIAHIATYTLTIMLMGGLPIVLLGGLSIAHWWILYCIINGLGHMVTDYFTSRASGKAYREGKIRKFWAIIGFDQFIHMSTLWIVLAILLMFI